MKAAWRLGLAAFVLVAGSVHAVAKEKPKFDPAEMFGISLDSHLPFDQESHANDTNYVHAFTADEKDRVWLKRFRGFTPRTVSVAEDGGVQSVTAFRREDIDNRKLLALFKAMDGYFAGFDGIIPDGECSATNRTWAGTSPDGIGFSINVHECFREPNGKTSVKMELRSDSARCGAEFRALRLEKESKARIAAAYRMMRSKEYEGAWTCSKDRKYFALCFVKGGLGLVEHQMSNYMFYWNADDCGNIDATVAFGEGATARLCARFLPEENAFDVRCDWPECKDSIKKQDGHGDEAGVVASTPKKEALFEGRARPFTGKSREKRICEYLNMYLGTSDIVPPLARTIPEKVTAAPFGADIRPSKTKKLSSFSDLPDINELPKRGAWVFNGSGVCKLRIGFDGGNDVLLAATIGEAARSDANAPSFWWLKRIMPQMVDAATLYSRVPNGVPEGKAERIAELAEQEGLKVEEMSLVLDMFWHYRREDQLHIRFPKDKSGSVAAFIKQAFDGVLEFPVEMEVY